jgi:hypothetical protein
MKQEINYTMNLSDKLSIVQKPINSIMFNINDECIITIDDTGFKYKDQLIEDGGEVYRLFKEFLIQAKNN